MPIRISDILVCPVCKGRLAAGEPGSGELICPRCLTAYGVHGDIPVMTPDSARKLSEAEVQALRSRERSKSAAGAQP